MNKVKKGFTLVELLVVIGILGVLMATLYPAISGVMVDMNMNTASINARWIVQGIIQSNTDRSAKGKPTVWPHISEKDGLSTDTTDIAGKTFGTSTEYFKALYDIDNQTKGNEWEPYVQGYEAKRLSATGVANAQPGYLLQNNNAWTVCAGLTDDMGDFHPVVISRNADTSTFATTGDNDMSTKTDRIELGKKFPQPFGNAGCVVAFKGGGAEKFKVKECRLKDIYKDNSFTVPDGITLKYLEP